VSAIGRKPPEPGITFNAVAATEPNCNRGRRRPLHEFTSIIQGVLIVLKFEMAKSSLSMIADGTIRC
jgi:hypothetical protein